MCVPSRYDYPGADPAVGVKPGGGGQEDEEWRQLMVVGTAVAGSGIRPFPRTSSLMWPAKPVSVPKALRSRQSTVRKHGPCVGTQLSLIIFNLAK
jgi:hypothetical protein